MKWLHSTCEINGANAPFRIHPTPSSVWAPCGNKAGGDYPAGSYIRNPPGSFHAPFSHEGCTLFVKLNHFDPRDTAEVRINTRTTLWLPGQGGLEVMPLHGFETEHTALVR